MYKKVKFYSVILAIIYVSVFSYSLYEGVIGFIAGFKLGMTESASSADRSTPYVLSVKVRGLDNIVSFPDELQDIVSGDIIKTESTELAVKLKSTILDNQPFLKILSGIRVLALFSTIILTIIIPFYFFSIVKLVTKDQIIDMKVIKKIRITGWLLVGIFTMSFMYTTVGYYIANTIIHLKHYKIIMDYSNYMSLILGVVILLLAEILHISLKMKEEQDLTI